MVKTSESAIKTVIIDKRKWLLRLNQKVLEVGTASDAYAFVTHTPLGRMQAPKPTYFCKRNVETPYRSPRGRQTAKSAYGGAGTGTRRKRMPFCNGADRGCDIILRESGQTSSWSLFTGEFPEPSLREESK
jgi:hypothetical protein